MLGIASSAQLQGNIDDLLNIKLMKRFIFRNLCLVALPRARLVYFRMIWNLLGLRGSPVASSRRPAPTPGRRACGHMCGPGAWADFMARTSELISDITPANILEEWLPHESHLI